MPEEVKRERSRSGCMADLSESLTAADIAVLKRLNSAGEAWVVGGWVRDALAGITADEVDMATTLRPSEVARLFPRTVMIGEAFGTILVLPDEKSNSAQDEPSWEVTTLRSEGTYGDGRRPDEVEFGEDIQEDLARRDFTINAMALDSESGEVIDPFGGREDLAAGVVRAVGDAVERMAEDGLRIMRAFRFLSGGTLGYRRLDSALSAAIRENVAMLDKVSAERKWAELSKILQGQNTNLILAEMDSHRVLAKVLPETILRLEADFSGAAPVDLAILCSNDLRSGADLASHLKGLLRLSNDEAATIAFVHELHCDSLQTDQATLRRYNAALSESMKAEVVAYFGAAGEAYATAAAAVAPPRVGNNPLVNGNLLISATGLAAGPRLGRLKGWLHRRQIENDLATAEEVLELLDSIDWREDEPENWPTLSWP